MLDAERKPDEVEIHIAARVHPPALDVLPWHPEFLADEYGYHEWVQAATAEEAVATLKDLWGEGAESSKDWAKLMDELDPVWMRPEALPPDSPHFSYAQAEQGTPHPMAWNEVPEGTPGAALYWRYEA